MAMYHCHVKVINRASGRSSVAAAAYRSASKLHNQRDGLTHDYTKKAGVVFSQIILPENAPKAFGNRETLWNAVEKAEKRSDAQTAREIELALPNELSHSEQITMVREYILEHFTQQGMIADFTIHDKGDDNPHVHIMLTLRTLTPDGFGKKERTWNQRQNCEYWRECWANIYNRKLQEKGIDGRVDHRSYRRQGLELEPTIHLGTTANQLEKMGIPTERGEINRQIKRRNQALRELAQLQAEKEKIINQEHDRLATLKNRYLELAIQIQNQKSTKDILSTDIRRNNATKDDLLERQKDLETLQERYKAIKALFFDDNARNQLDSLRRSEQQAINALYRDHQLTPDKIPQAIKNVSQKSLEASEKLLTLDDLTTLDQLLSEVFDEFLKLLQDLVEYLGFDQVPLERLASFAQNPALSPAEIWALAQAQNQLQLGIQGLQKTQEAAREIDLGQSLGR